MPQVLVSMDPDETCLIVRDSMPEDKLQAVRDRFPYHHIIVCCRKHAPSDEVFMAPIAALHNKPDCAMVLCPDEDWDLFDDKHK